MNKAINSYESTTKLESRILQTKLNIMNIDKFQTYTNLYIKVKVIISF